MEIKVKSQRDRGKERSTDKRLGRRGVAETNPVFVIFYCVCVCNMCIDLHRDQKRVRSPEAGTTDHRELPGVGARNQNQVP